MTDPTGTVALTAMACGPPYTRRRAAPRTRPAVRHGAGQRLDRRGRRRLVCRPDAAGGGAPHPHHPPPDGAQRLHHRRCSARPGRASGRHRAVPAVHPDAALPLGGKEGHPAGHVRVLPPPRCPDRRPRGHAGGHAAGARRAHPAVGASAPARSRPAPAATAAAVPGRGGMRRPAGRYRRPGHTARPRRRWPLGGRARRARRRRLRDRAVGGGGHGRPTEGDRRSPRAAWRTSRTWRRLRWAALC